MGVTGIVVVVVADVEVDVVGAVTVVLVVGMAVVWMLSLSATGMPCSGPRIRP